MSIRRSPTRASFRFPSRRRLWSTATPSCWHGSRRGSPSRRRSRSARSTPIPARRSVSRTPMDPASWCSRSPRPRWPFSRAVAPKPSRTHSPAASSSRNRRIATRSSSTLSSTCLSPTFSHERTRWHFPPTTCGVSIARPSRQRSLKVWQPFVQVKSKTATPSI